MDEVQLFDISREALWMVIKLAGPILLTGLTIGLIIALFQALTQLQEMTLTFVPKILGVFFALYLLIPYMGSTLVEYANRLADQIIGLQ